MIDVVCLDWRCDPLLVTHVCKNGIVVLDEFNYDKFAGETAALKEVLQMGDICMERFSFAPFVAFFRR